jgi:hypothetical protein
MPLRLSSDSPEDVAKSLNSSPIKPAYLVVYASVVNGRMWCGDCRDAEPFVNAKFGDSGETATVVYAGSKPEWVPLPLLHPFLCFILGFFQADQTNRWRSADNIWKKEPFLVTALPTIIKVTADGVSTKVDIIEFEELIL